MELVEVMFKLTYDDPLIDISRRFESFKMYTWCNRESDVIEVIAENEKEYSSIMQELHKPKEIIAEVSSHKGVIIKKKCSCKERQSVVRFADDLGLLYVPPEVLEMGWFYYRVVAFRHEDFKELINRLEQAKREVKILRRVQQRDFIPSLMTLHADSLFSNITRKQMDALLTAYRYGYYTLPRKADVKALAAKKRVPRTTFHEHLKKAENKLVSGLIPYIQLYTHERA